MPALSLRSGKALVLTALVASLLGALLIAPVASAQSPEEEQYGCGVGGCEEEESPDRGGSDRGASDRGGSNPSGGGPSGSGSGPGGGSESGARLGPDPSVTGVGSDSSSDSDSGSDAGSTSGGSSDGGSGNSSADKKDAKARDGRSLGELLSGGTERVATPTAAVNGGNRAASAVNDSGGNGLVWLLLALGAVTAVAAAGVAVRRRQARQLYSH